MEARELLFLAFAGAVIRGALFAQPLNVTYHIDEKSCNLEVTWLLAESPNRTCTRKYKAARPDSEDLKQCEEYTYWEENVALGGKIAFDVETSSQKNCEDLSALNGDVQNGAAGTGARNVSCTWWNRNYMKCLWQAGEKASPDTSYRLSYWYDSLDKAQPCTNFNRSGSDFQCGFLWTVQHVSLIAISIQGNSGNIQPICWHSHSINCLVQFDPPVLSVNSTDGSKVVLQWTKPGNSLDYEVQVNGKETRKYTNRNRAEIPVDPDVRHTFQVRVKLQSGRWSEWSEMIASGGTTSTFPFLLLILIPLFVALLLVILLIYLKRIKKFILPKIPDPANILKSMFEEQNEIQPTHETTNNEETHSLMIVEPAGNEK